MFASEYREVLLSCFLDCRTTTSKQSTNYILIDPVHLHVKQLYNAYAFFPSITYYRKVELDVGKVESSMTTNSLLSVATIADNWLFGFDAFSSAESLQNQYVGRFHSLSLPAWSGDCVDHLRLSVQHIHAIRACPEHFPGDEL